MAYPRCLPNLAYPLAAQDGLSNMAQDGLPKMTQDPPKIQLPPDEDTDA